MEPSEPIYESGMRSPQLKVLRYEWPMFLATLLAAAILGGIYYLVIAFYFDQLGLNNALIILGGMGTISMLFVFWGASYYARGVLVFPDRLVLDMAFSSRQAPFSNIAAIKELSLEETKKTFFSLSSINLTPSVDGAIMIQRKKGRDWVFCPENPAEFLAAARKAMSSAAGAEAASEAAPDTKPD